MRLIYSRGGVGIGLGLLLSGCPTGGEDDSATETLTSLTEVGSSTQTPATDDATSTADSGSTTSCPAGELGCSCRPDDTCDGDLLCEGGTCQAPGDDTTTTDDTTTGGPAACGNGMAEPGDLCLDEMSTPFVMGAGTTALTVANFDSDPGLDLVVANRNADTVSIRLGDGMGDFGVQDTFDTGTGPVGIGHGDFDGDGNLDVVTVNTTSLNVTVLPGTGTGDFLDASITVALGAMLTPTDLAVADLEDDGDPDVLVTESTMGMVHVLRLDMGMFMTDTFGTGAGPSAIHTVDFSGNGIPDVVTADATGNTVSLLLGNGFGQLGGATSASAGTSPSDAASGDINGDSLTDAIVTNPSGNVTVRLGNGLGDFGGQLPFGVMGGPQALIAADLDLDGDTDLAVACADGFVRVMLGNGGTLVPGPEIPVGAMPNDIFAADVNEDGLLDLITANLGAGTVSVILSNA